MRIWFPVIRANSGSDVYMQRLVAGLSAHGVDARLQWFDRRFEFAPDLLRHVRAPAGTDLIHANSWNGFAFARAGVPLIITAFHCVYQCGFPEWKSYAQKFYHDQLIGRYEKRSFNRASLVIAMTSSAACDFLARFSLPRTEVIHGWVDTGVFCPGEGAWAEDGRVRVLIVGNNSKRKGMDLLPELRRRLAPHFLITVVGGLRGQRVGINGGVTYKAGLSIDELVSEYQRSDIVVSLSRYEGFGYSALEAMACARPVVAFDVTGIRDVVVNGLTGILVPPECPDQIAQSCEYLAAHPNIASRYGANGTEIVSKKFKKDQALASYIHIYEQQLRYI